MKAEDRILKPGQMETPAEEIHFLFLPARDLFSRRAERFRFLSHNYPLGDYMAFLALLADAQQKLLNQFPELPLPGPDQYAMCFQHGMPLLAAHSWPRNPIWRWGLNVILGHMKQAALPSAASETVTSLEKGNEVGLEEKADRILAGDLADISPQELPFVAAALQVYWVHMATSLGESAFGRLEQGALCPVCGSYPCAGIVNVTGARQGLRYLSCSLCASQWHMVRIKCSTCGSTHGIDYYILEGSNGSVKAESCDDCNFYLKLLYLGKGTRMEAMADDLATLALDMLMDNKGKKRRGPNLFFHPGSHAASGAT